MSTKRCHQGMVETSSFTERSADTDGSFAGFEGPRVKVSGTLVTRVDGIIDLDLFREDESAPGGRKLLGKLKRASGPFEILVPAAIGRLEAWTRFVDQTGDGPSGDDPRGSVKGLVVSSGPIQDVTITLVSLGEEVAKPPPDRGRHRPRGRVCAHPRGEAVLLQKMGKACRPALPSVSRLYRDAAAPVHG